jgi:thioredoxin 2
MEATSVNVNVVKCDVCGTKNRVPAAADGVPRCGKCHSPLPWITDADDETYGAVVESPAIPVLIDLWAPWCGPCRMVSPALEQLAHEFAGRLKLVKINVDSSPHVAQRHDARSIPMLLILNRGQVVSRQVGAAPEHVLRSWIEGALENVS